VGQIIAIGGGSRFTEGGCEVDEYIISQTGVRAPKAGFFGTANGDPPGYAESFHARFGELGCETTAFSLHGRTLDLSLLLEQDLVFVGGGNTKSMLALWHEWGVVDLLRQAYDAGTVLAGVSAGAICWFDQGVTDSWADSLRVIDCLGYIEGSCCPHYSGEPERRPAYLAQVRRGEAKAGVAICDGAAVHYCDGELVEALAWVDGASVLRVEAIDGEARETELPMHRL